MYRQVSSLVKVHRKLFKMSKNVIDIDGSVMEGGGQILRMSLAFSALLKKPIRVFNIRAGRSTPGLRPQHLAGLQLVRDICSAKLIGGNVGSTEIEFHPGEMKSGKFLADPGTAGSIMLLFQVSLPCLLFTSGPAELHLKGGTNAEMAPQIDHMFMVFKPIVEKFGVNFNCNLRKRGYYPKGGGEVIIKTEPVIGCLKPVEVLDPGNVKEFFGRSFVAGVLPIKMAHTMADSASRILRQHFPGTSLKLDRVKEEPHLAVGNGSGIVIAAKTSTECLLGGSSLGKRGIMADEVGESAATDLVQDIKSGSCVDHFTQDQLIIFMVLAKGKSKVRCGDVTLHTQTAIHIAEKLTEVKFHIEKHETAGYSVIECDGIGFSR